MYNMMLNRRINFADGKVLTQGQRVEVRQRNENTVLRLNLTLSIW
jgi:hypothetical protein